MITRHVLEAPWGLICLLGLVAVAALVALAVTQMGKYLNLALAALALAVAVLGADLLVVTDRERIETLIDQMAQAVEDEDPTRLLTAFDLDGDSKDSPTVTILGVELHQTRARLMLEGSLRMVEFDFVHVADLDVKVFPQSRQAVADFKVTSMATARSMAGGAGRTGIGSGNTRWQLGFRETAPKTWKVTTVEARGEHADEIETAVGRRL